MASNASERGKGRQKVRVPFFASLNLTISLMYNAMISVRWKALILSIYDFCTTICENEKLYKWRCTGKWIIKCFIISPFQDARLLSIKYASQQMGDYLYVVVIRESNLSAIQDTNLLMEISFWGAKRGKYWEIFLNVPVCITVLPNDEDARSNNPCGVFAFLREYFSVLEYSTCYTDFPSAM